MLSSSSEELILSISQSYGWVKSTISSEFPLTSFIIFPQRVRTAKKVQIGILSFLVEGMFQRGAVPTTATSWCGKASGWGYYTEKEGKSRDIGQSCIFTCTASSWVWFTVNRKAHSSCRAFLGSFVRLDQAWVYMSVASATRIIFCRNQKNQAEVQMVTELWHTPTFRKMIPRVLPGHKKRVVSVSLCLSLASCAKHAMWNSVASKRDSWKTGWHFKIGAICRWQGPLDSVSDLAVPMQSGNVPCMNYLHLYALWPRSQKEIWN